MMIDECRNMLLEVAPELASQPFYAIDATLLRDLPCHRKDGVLGWADTSREFDRNVADRIPDYQGPGSLIVLNLPAIEAESAPGQFERCVRNTALHEAAHVLPVRRVTEPADTKFSREFAATRMESEFNRIAASYEPDPRAGDTHDAAFVRRCIHVFYRATVSGFDVSPHHLFGPQCWLSRAEIYLTTLLKECVTMAGETFTTIEATPPPDYFATRWQADLIFYDSIFTKGN